MYVVGLSAARVSAPEVDIPAAASAAALRREEGFHQSREGREIARLNQNLAGACDLRDHALAAHHASEETCCGLAQSVVRSPLPSDEVARVNDVALAGREPLAVNRTERRD